MRLKELIVKGTETLSGVYAEREAREIMLRCAEDLAGIRRGRHIIEASYEVPADAGVSIEKALARLCAGEPLQYVTGKADFYGRAFGVTPAVLIPRQETELLCRTVLDRLGSGRRRSPKILDLCTGSGCIAWTLALECPGAEVVGVDISAEALEVAAAQDFSEEMFRTGAAAPEFVRADVLDPSSGIPGFPESGKWDVVVSNPPYVMDSEKALMHANVLDHEPHLALFVPDDDPLKFYVAVSAWASELLSEDGFGVVEINEALGRETADVFLQAGFSKVGIIRDLNDKERFVLFSR